MKNRYVQYYVEGEDEVKLLNTLKGKMRLIRAGKVQKLNATTCTLTDARLRTLSQNTMVVLIFDTDAGNPEILKKKSGQIKTLYIGFRNCHHPPGLQSGGRAASQLQNQYHSRAAK